MQKTGLYGNVYGFAIDYQPVSTSQIYDIHEKKMILYKMFRVIKKILVIV